MTEIRFKKKRAITLPTFKFEIDKPIYVKIVGVIHEGASRGKAQLDPEGKPKKPPQVAQVINLSTGEEGQIIVATIVKTELLEAYPNDGYVGLGFGITKQKRKEGKQYDPYTLEEIELPAEYAGKSAESNVSDMPAQKAAGGKK